MLKENLSIYTVIILFLNVI